MTAPRRSVLLLADDDPSHAAVVSDHVGALLASRHDVTLVNPIGRPRVDLELHRHDALVIHWSLVPSWDSYLAPGLRAQISAFRRAKLQFIQDEHRWVDDATRTMRDLGIHLLFSVLPREAAAMIYGGRLPGVEVRPTLTGYVPDSLVSLNPPPPERRPVDVGYRGREIPFWMGRLAFEKAAIGREVLARAESRGLVCDIAWREEDRVYGEAWLELLMSCRACLGTPSGASIADFDGSVERAVREYVHAHPNATFDEVSDAVLRPYEGNIQVDAISPRMFEAAATGTAMILFPGSYSGVLVEGEHYIQLERDYGNFDDVVRLVRDDEFLVELTSRARRDLIDSGDYSYRLLTQEFDETIDRIAAQHSPAHPRKHGVGRRSRKLLRQLARPPFLRKPSR